MCQFDNNVFEKHTGNLFLLNHGLYISYLLVRCDENNNNNKNNQNSETKEAFCRKFAHCFIASIKRLAFEAFCVV